MNSRTAFTASFSTSKNRVPSRNSWISMKSDKTKELGSGNTQPKLNLLAHRKILSKNNTFGFKISPISSLTSRT